MKNHRPQRLATRLIHAGEPRPRIGGAVNVPVFLSSTYEFSGAAPGAAPRAAPGATPGTPLDAAAAAGDELRYIRYSNTPNHRVLAAKLASLENAEDALVTASGMAAISSVAHSLLSPGDHVIAQDVLYGGTHFLMSRELPRLGIQVDRVPGDDPAAWRAALRPNTRLFYVETIANPLLGVPDLAAVPRFAREHGVVSVIDNTFATPVFFRPAEHGYDLSIHSVSKYLNGHSDIVGGAVIGRRDLIDRVLHALHTLGGSMDPHACYLLYRGLRTLELRVRRSTETARRLARRLADHPAVSAVWYPGLDRPLPDVLEGTGGMVSFELRNASEHPALIDDFLSKLQIAIVAPSLGGVETLVSLPSRTSHAALAPEERRAAGIGDGLVRCSVGIEDPDDLIEDFENALM